MTISAASAAVFAKVKVFWMSLPVFEPARVRAGEQEDQRDGDELLGREAETA